MTRNRRQSIPDDLVDRIVKHRPHLGVIVRNLRAHPHLAAQLEKALADNYLLGAGAPDITAMETWKLTTCCVGRGYGERSE